MTGRATTVDRAVIGRKDGGIEYGSNSFSHDSLQYTKKTNLNLTKVDTGKFPQIKTLSS